MTTFGDSYLGGTFGDTGGTFADLSGALTHWPSLELLVAFDTDPMAETVTWTDLTDYLIGATITRGRGTEIEDVSAGTMTVTLDNTIIDSGAYAGARPFDIDDTAGPFYGQLAANVRIRLQATWDGTTTPVYDGYVEDWPVPDSPQWDAHEVTIECVDAFGLFAERRIRPAKPFTIGDATLGKLDDSTIAITGPPVFDEARAGQRIDRVLTLIGWPATRRDIDQGVSRLIAHAPDPTTKVVTYLQQCARSEYGRLFVTASGDIRFDQRRAWSANATQATSQVTLTDQVGTNYDQIVLSPGGRARIHNQVVRAQDGGGREFTARDGTSIARYGTLESSVTDLLTLSEQEIQDQANYVLGRFANPSRFVETVTIDPLTGLVGLWPHVLERELGDRVTVERTPRPAVAAVSAEYWIEGIDHTIDNVAKRWRTSWRLAEVDTGTYFTIGTHELDGTAVLAY